LPEGIKGNYEKPPVTINNVRVETQNQDFQNMSNISILKSVKVEIKKKSWFIQYKVLIFVNALNN
jgi:hypothetical protein